MALTISPQSPSTGPIAMTSHRAPVARWALHLVLGRVAEAVRPAPVHVLSTARIVAGLGACASATAIVTALLGLVLR